MTEAELQGAVIEAGRLFGFRIAHFRPARSVRGWRTPVAADGAGFPDLVLARPGELVFAELKASGGRLHPDQATWLDVLGRTGGCNVHVWRPEDWLNGTVEAHLRPAGYGGDE